MISLQNKRTFQFLPSTAIGADGYYHRLMSVRPSVHLSGPNDVTALTLKGFQLLAWNLVHGTLKFSMIALDRVWGMMTHIRKCGEIIYYDLKWHDAIYHANIYYCKLPRLASTVFAFSGLGRPRVLPFSERLVFRRTNRTCHIIMWSHPCRVNVTFCFEYFYRMWISWISQQSRRKPIAHA